MRAMPLPAFAVTALVSSAIATISPALAQIGGLGGNLGQYGMPQIGNDNGANQQSQPAGAAPAEEKKDEFPPDDPAVNAATPPPAGSKIQTKVGWCEVQVFGHTFTDAGLTAASMKPTHMHLSDRLQQLNQKLGFMPGKKGIVLMDSIDDMVTLVSKRPPSEVAKKTAK